MVCRRSEGNSGRDSRIHVNGCSSTPSTQRKLNISTPVHHSIPAPLDVICEPPPPPSPDVCGRSGCREVASS